MTLVESREEALWDLRRMHDAVQNSGKTKPGFYSVIGLVGAAGKLGRKGFVNSVAHWNTRAWVEMFLFFFFVLLCFVFFKPNFWCVYFSV